jgi:hypothetical protein
MGDLRPDNQPPDEPHGLPDLPAEWGTIVIPDDASELAAEADAVRRELRADARRARIRGVFGLRGQPASLGIPIVIMTVAIITTLASLLVVTWGTQPPLPGPTSTTATSGSVPSTNTKALGDLILPKANGDMVKIRDIAPLILLLIDGCECGQLISDVAAHVPRGVTVVPITGSPVSGDKNDPANVVRLTDTKGVLRGRYGPETPDGQAAALVVNGQGELINNLQHVTKYADIAPMELK